MGTLSRRIGAVALELRALAGAVPARTWESLRPQAQELEELAALVGQAEEMEARVLEAMAEGLPRRSRAGRRAPLEVCNGCAAKRAPQ